MKTFLLPKISRLRRRARAFSLVEILSVLALVAVMTGLAVPALSNLGSAGKLSHSGNQIAGLLDFARSSAMAHNSLTAVVIATHPTDGSSHRAVTVFELRSRADGVPVASSDWNQIARWETLPAGVLVDSDPSTLTLNSSHDAPGVPGVPSPALPQPSHAGRTLTNFRYLVFLPSGSLLSGKSNSLRLVEGVMASGTGDVSYTRRGTDGAVNFYEMTVLGSTGRTLVTRP